MDPIQIIREFFLWLKYRHAILVNSREELDAALNAMPPRIVVEGDETLRAYAASLVHPETQEASRFELEMPAAAGDMPAYLVVPTVGRIRDGYRSKTKPKRSKRLGLSGGMDAVLVATIGIIAALLVEWLSFPDLSPRIIHGVHRQAGAEAAPDRPTHLSAVLIGIAIPVLAAISVGALAWLVWQALGLGRPIETGWRLEHRIHGRLVMARVRRRVN